MSRTFSNTTGFQPSPYPRGLMDLSALQQIPPLQESEGSKEFPSGLCVKERNDHASFEDLPISILFLIFSKCTPQDVVRLTIVSRQCGEVARSDQLWNALLPPHARDIARSAHEGPLEYRSAKDLYLQLTNHVLLGDGLQGYWLDRKTGVSSWSVSAVALANSWDYWDHQYWRFVATVDARYTTVAELAQLWRLDLAGEVNVKLPPGEYTVAWVLELDKEGCDEGTDVICSLSENGAEEKITEVKLSTSSRGWAPYNFGHFTVTSDSGDGESLEEVNLKVLIYNLNHKIEKTLFALWLDGIIIRSGKFDI